VRSNKRSPEFQSLRKRERRKNVFLREVKKRMASTSKTPSTESLKNDEEEDIPSEERSLTDLKFKIKPFNKKVKKSKLQIFYQ
jgi:hypothetical protein